MSENLKKCPFCNAEAELHFSEGESGKRYYWVSCNKCSCIQTLFDTPQEAIDFWNNRPIEDEQASEIKSLREALTLMVDFFEEDWQNPPKNYVYVMEKARKALKGEEE